MNVELADEKGAKILAHVNRIKKLQMNEELRKTFQKNEDQTREGKIPHHVTHKKTRKQSIQQRPPLSEQVTDYRRKLRPR